MLTMLAIGRPRAATSSRKVTQMHKQPIAMVRCTISVARKTASSSAVDEKISLIKALKCDVFLDDLPEVLEDAQFPAATKRLWFSEKSPPAGSAMIQVKHWNEVAAHCAR